MTALQIKATKNFMNALLVSEAFDDFELEEAVITTFNTFEIDGHLVKEFYTSEEIADMTLPSGKLPEFSLWKDIRNICFQLIKGKKTPAAFRVVLHASPIVLEKIAGSPDCEVTADNIRSLVLNIRFENGHVTCVTATSFKTFIMDKTVDTLWAQYIRKFFSNLQLDFEETV